MGIKGLSDFIRKNSDCYQVKHMSNYFGRKIAVDISVFLYKSIRSAGEDGWMKLMINLLLSLKKQKIKTVCIFDGPNAPEEKLKERAERRSNSNKVKEKALEIQDLILEVENIIEDVENKDSKIELELELRNKIRDACMKQKDSDKYEAINYRNPYEALKILKLVEQKFLKQSIAITPEHAAQVKELLDYLGLAYIQADGEAETLCSYMCIKGLVDAVFTEDSDVLAYETPLFLSHFDPKNETVQEIVYEDLIDQLDLNRAQFKDFCIMCSCDYNKRIKMPPSKKSKSLNPRQTGIGPVKAYKLLKEHGTIENIEYMTELDTSPLIYERCRVLFTIPSMYDNITLPYNREMNTQGLENFLIKHNCKFLLPKIKDLWRPTAVVFEDENGEIEEKFKVNKEEELMKDERNEMKKFIDTNFHTKKLIKSNTEKIDEGSDVEEDNHPKRLIKSNIDTESNVNVDTHPKRLIKSNTDNVYVEPKKVYKPVNIEDEFPKRLLKPLPPSSTSSNSKELIDEVDKKYDYILFTDGSCDNLKTKAGGWACIIVDVKQNKEYNYKGSVEKTTNNMMEMKAVIEAMKNLELLDKNAKLKKIKVYTDSEYVKNGATLWMKKWKSNGWKTANKEPVKNFDLWQEIDKYQLLYKMDWEWVKAHSKDNGYKTNYNSKADSLANYKNKF